MRTMYRVEERVYIGCEGRNSEYTQIGEYMNTVEEAVEYAKANVKKETGWDTGDYRIYERTIDEKTFTVTDKKVVDYDYYKEVQQYENAKRDIEIYTKKIAELEVGKTRCKTEKGIEKKNKDIEWYKERIAHAEKIMAEKN